MHFLLTFRLTLVLDLKFLLFSTEWSLTSALRHFEMIVVATITNLFTSEITNRFRLGFVVRCSAQCQRRHATEQLIAPNDEMSA